MTCHSNLYKLSIDTAKVFDHGSRDPKYCEVSLQRHLPQISQGLAQGPPSMELSGVRRVVVGGLHLEPRATAHSQALDPAHVPTIYTCMYTCVHRHIHIQTSVYVNIHIYTCRDTQIQIQIYTYIHTCIYMHV